MHHVNFVLYALEMNDTPKSVEQTHDKAPADPVRPQSSKDGSSVSSNGNDWLSEDEIQDSGLGADSELLGLLGQC